MLNIHIDWYCHLSDTLTFWEYCWLYIYTVQYFLALRPFTSIFFLPPGRECSSRDQPVCEQHYEGSYSYTCHPSTGMCLTPAWLHNCCPTKFSHLIPTFHFFILLACFNYFCCPSYRCHGPGWCWPMQHTSRAHGCTSSRNLKLTRVSSTWALRTTPLLTWWDRRATLGMVRLIQYTPVLNKDIKTVRHIILKALSFHYDITQPSGTFAIHPYFYPFPTTCMLPNSVFWNVEWK